jgi:hypothetical protein
MAAITAGLPAAAAQAGAPPRRRCCRRRRSPAGRRARSTAASASGSCSTLSTNTGSTLPRERIARASALTVGVGHGLLARGIDLAKQQCLGVRQHSREVVHQVARAAVAMRLEGNHHAAARPGAADRLESALELRRVMAVIVHQQCARRRPRRPRRAPACGGRCRRNWPAHAAAARPRPRAPAPPRWRPRRSARCGARRDSA